MKVKTKLSPGLLPARIFPTVMKHDDFLDQCIFRFRAEVSFLYKFIIFSGARHGEKAGAHRRKGKKIWGIEKKRGQKRDKLEAENVPREGSWGRSRRSE